MRFAFQSWHYLCSVTVSMAETTKKVLVVEDNDDWREFLAMLIKRLGYEVFEATTGIEAIERASSIYPDLILMDLGLPQMSGSEAIACLKMDPASRDIPVVVQTAWNDDIHTNRALEAGAAEILHKPIDVKTLLDVLRKYLSAGYGSTSDAAA